MSTSKKSRATTKNGIQPQLHGAMITTLVVAFTALSIVFTVLVIYNY